MVGLVGHHDPNLPQNQMTTPKHTLVLEVLELLIQNAAMTSKAIDWEGSNASASDLGAVRLSGPGQTLSLWVSCPDSSVPVPPGFQRRESQKENCSS